MAGLDPSIPLQVRGLQLESPMAQTSGVLSLLGVLQQQKLREQQMQLAQQQAAEAQRKSAQEQQLRSALSNLPPDADQTTLLRTVAPFASPDALLRTHQSSLDRAATLAANKERYAEQIAQRAKDAEMLHEFRMGRLQTDQQRAEEAKRHNQVMEGFRRAIGGLRQPAPVTPVTIQDPNNPNGTIIIDGRTREVLGKGPKLTEAGKLETKRQFNMQGIGSTIAEAEAILTNKAKPPTGSGLGTALDVAGSFVGVSPSGAKEAQQLRAIGGALVSKMPRMEGPQSDKDLQLYREMAGMVGDSSVPIDRRVAALEEVKKLWTKYERLNPGTFEERRSDDIGVPPPGAVRPR